MAAQEEAGLNGGCVLRTHGMLLSLAVSSSQLVSCSSSWPWAIGLSLSSGCDEEILHMSCHNCSCYSNLDLQQNSSDHWVHGEEEGLAFKDGFWGKEARRGLIHICLAGVEMIVWRCGFKMSKETG